MASKTCSVEGCNWKHKAKGLCKNHYRAMLRGTLETPRYSKPRGPVGMRTEFPFDVEKIDGVWYRRPTGSTGPWELVPGFVGVAA